MEVSKVFQILDLFFLRHNDLPWNVRKFVHNQLGEVNLSSDLGRVDPWARSDWSHTDIPRLRAGLVGAQVNFNRDIHSSNTIILSVDLIIAYQYSVAIITLVCLTSTIFWNLHQILVISST